MLTDGLATTEEPIAELRPLEGDQLYVLAPPALSVTELPAQMVVEEGFAVTAGNAEKVTDWHEDELVPQALEAVTQMAPVALNADTTEIEVVPWPDKIATPEGTVQE